MAAHQPAQEPPGDRLRLIAALSAAALALALPLAAATAGPHDPGQHRQAGHSESQPGPGGRGAADGD